MTAPWRGAVAFFTGQWLAAMDDTITVVTNAAGKGTYNPATRLYDGTPSNVYGPAVALIRPRGASTPQVAEQQVLVDTYDVYVPDDATGFEPDQQLTVDAIGSPTVSPLLAGLTMTVDEVEADSYNARIRLGCTLNRGGGS